MDFFEHQDQQRRRTKWLVGLFVLAIIMMIVMIYSVATLLYTYAGTNEAVNNSLYGWYPTRVQWWNPELLGYVSGITLTIILCGSVYMTSRLAGGGKAVAAMMGGRLVGPDSGDPDERRLLNIVEEMAIASGTPVPDVYLMEHERGINAFAAGFSISDSVIAVTHGTLHMLTRDELQGVIAHEFSHILNGDMRLNIRLTGILHGILCIAMIGYFMMRSSFYGQRRSSREGNPAALIIGSGLFLWIIGYIGVFFGKLIKSAVSRSREFLADASAVQFTRNPTGIGSALKKIGGFGRHGLIENPRAETISHMFFANSLKSSFFGMMATHPPIRERIARVDPEFRKKLDQHSDAFSQPAFASSNEVTSAFANEGAIHYGPDDIAAHIGHVGPQQAAFAHHFLQAMADRLRNATHSSYSARALVYAILLDDDESIRREQLKDILSSADPLIFTATQELHLPVVRAGHRARLPMIDMCLPALRMMSTKEYLCFMRNVSKLIAADGKIKLFEYIFRKIIGHHLQPYFEQVDRKTVRHRTFNQVAQPTALVLSTLAFSGHPSKAEAEEAFLAGMQRLTKQTYKMTPPSEVSIEKLDWAFDALEHCAPLIKRELIGACVVVASHDDKISVKEAELLRGIGDAIGCPMPPIAIQPNN